MFWNLLTRVPFRYNPIDWNSSRHFCSRSVPFLPLQIHDCLSTAEGHRKPRFFTPGSTDQSLNTLRRVTNVARNNTWHAHHTRLYGKRFTCWSHLFKERDLRIPPQNHATLIASRRSTFIYNLWPSVRKYSIFIMEKRLKQIKRKAFMMENKIYSSYNLKCSVGELTNISPLT